VGINERNGKDWEDELIKGMMKKMNKGDDEKNE
jgi:hypothetical protein